MTGSPGPTHAHSLSLDGATVVVTRPAGAAAAMRRRIDLLGGAMLSLPGLSVRAMPNSKPQQTALRDARNADIVIFVSPNAVRFAFASLPSLRFGCATRVCAIGAATARALARRGVGDVLWPAERQDSEGLLALPAFKDLSQRRVAVIGAPGGRELLPQVLRQRGAVLQSIHVYQRTAARLDRRHFDALLGAAPPLLVLLSSAEALGNLQRVLAPPLFLRLAAAEAIVSSLRLAHAARAAGFTRTYIAASAGSQDMLAAAQAALAQHRL